MRPDASLPRIAARTSALAAGNATSRLLDSAPAQLAACLYLTHECSYRLPLGLEAEVAREGLPSHVLVLSGHAPAVAPTLARIGLSNVRAHA